MMDKIKEFCDFYDLLMSNAPAGYIPWFFPCEKNGKDPCPLAIIKIDASSKGSWHHPSARLSREQCINHLRAGYNLGISARKDDPLIIGDIDSSEYLDETPQNTLIVTSRKREGIHFFGWDKNKTAKINLPTDDGEMRSNNQYVLACGSYVPFDITNSKDKKSYDKLSESARKDPLIGYYTIKNNIPLRELSFEDLPQFFQDKENSNIRAEVQIKNNEEIKTYPRDGKYSDLFNLKVSDIIGNIPQNKRQGHPLHESDTDSNFSMSADGTLGHCWRHLVSLNAVQYLCVQARYCSCCDAGTPHKEGGIRRGISKIRGDKKAFEIAYQEAIKCGLIKERKREDAANIFSRLGQAQHFNTLQPYFYDRAGLFWMWNIEKFCWEITDEVEILNMINKSCGYDIISSKERNEILNALKQEGRKNMPKDIPKTFIQFKNKLVDLITGEEIEATPKYFAVNPIPYGLHKDKFTETPCMNKLFEEWVGKNHVKTLYQIIAYCILSDYPIHRLFCLIGSGMNGKSCFLRLLKKFIGEKNCCSTELDALMTSRFEVTRLYKKLVCLMGETNFNEISKTSILKKLTGQDMIGFEYKNKNPFEDNNYAKIIISTNNLPATTDKTIGFYRRWMIIDFPNQFSEQEEVLNRIPEEEYESLSIKCISILHDLLRDRKFHNEGDIEERMKRYEDRSNFLEKFITDFVDKGDMNGFITKNEFYKKFFAWSKENRHRELSETSFSLMVKKMGIEEGHKYFDWLYDGKGGNARVWFGIKWK